MRLGNLTAVKVTITQVLWSQVWIRPHNDEWEEKSHCEVKFECSPFSVIYKPVKRISPLKDYLPHVDKGMNTNPTPCIWIDELRPNLYLLFIFHDYFALEDK